MQSLIIQGRNCNIHIYIHHHFLEAMVSMACFYLARACIAATAMPNTSYAYPSAYLFLSLCFYLARATNRIGSKWYASTYVARAITRIGSNMACFYLYSQSLHQKYYTIAAINTANESPQPMPVLFVDTPVFVRVHCPHFALTFNHLIVYFPNL